MIVLPLWPHDMPRDKREWIQATAARIVHEDVMAVPAVSGSPGRILSFGRPPDFLCTSVVVSAENAENPQQVEAALTYLLLEEDDSRCVTEAEWLSAVMRCDVEYSHSVDEAGKVFYE